MHGIRSCGFRTILKKCIGLDIADQRYGIKGEDSPHFCHITERADPNPLSPMTNVASMQRTASGKARLRRIPSLYLIRDAVHRSWYLSI